MKGLANPGKGHKDETKDQPLHWARTYHSALILLPPKIVMTIPDSSTAANPNPTQHACYQRLQVIAVGQWTES